MLLLASCIFYMAFVPQYILILLVTILIDYVAALYIVRSEGGRRSGVHDKSQRNLRRIGGARVRISFGVLGLLST
jgi:hypothetical protein